MEKMYNPFLEGTTNEETTVSYILDKALNCSNEQKAVFKFFQYLISNKEKPIYNVLINELKQMLDDKQYMLIQTIYLDTYNIETKTFSRYAYFEERDDIRYLVSAFNIIYNNLSRLGAIAKNN